MNTIGFITEEILEQICHTVLNDEPTEQNSDLKDILIDIEFWEGGSVQIEDEDTIWIGGDNGRHQVPLKTILGFKSITFNK